MNYPILYIVCQNGRQLNNIAFGSMIWKSLFQAAVIFLASINAFDSPFLDIVTVTYSTLVFVELLNILLMVSRLKFSIIFVVVMSLIFYLISIFFIPDILGMVSVDAAMWLKIGVITLACWGPFRLAEFIRVKLFPSVSDKIMKIADNSAHLEMGMNDIADVRDMNMTSQRQDNDLSINNGSELNL